MRFTAKTPSSQRKDNNDFYLYKDLFSIAALLPDLNFPYSGCELRDDITIMFVPLRSLRLCGGSHHV
jgi:hypothetical protein